MDRIKILIVDDSTVMRILIKNILEEIDGFEVVGTATNGKNAFEKVMELSPDVVVMDLYMGDYDGVYGIRKIMASCPTPIVVLSSIGNTNLDIVMEALEAGAIDYLNKPAKNQSKIRDVENQLKQKIIVAYNSKNRLENKVVKRVKNTNPHTFDDGLGYDVLAIGSSTGGPSALERILGNLPSNLPIPIIIVQHMPVNFIASFSKRLESICKREVVVSSNGKPIEKGKVYIVEGGRNTILYKQKGVVRFQHTDLQYEAYNNPSIDSVFLSIADIYQSRSIGVILSGMGSDGVKGISAIKNEGGITVAQSEATCVVYGMPKRANEANAIEHNVNLNQIAPFLISAIA